MKTRHSYPKTPISRLTPEKAYNQSSVKKRCCLIIDPITCKDYMAKKIRAKDISVFAIFTDGLLSFFNKFSQLNTQEIHTLIEVESNKIEFDRLYFAWQYKDLEEILRELSHFEVVMVLNCNEYSLEETRNICHKLKLNFNSRETVKLLQSKYDIIEKCRQCKIPVCTQIKINRKKNLTETEMSQIASIGYPMFAKPINGCGSLGIFKISNYRDLDFFLAEKHNDIFIIQEFLKGNEYFVDMVSYKGIHYVSMVGRYDKELINNIPVYISAESVPFTSVEAKAAINYIRKILDCIGWENGLTHNELMLTDEGPRLIEINPRQSGGHNYINKLALYSHGKDQFDIFISHVLEDEQPKNEAISKDSNKEEISARFVLLNNLTYERPMTEFNAKKVINLDSYKEHVLFFKTGERIPVTKSLADTIGQIMLVNKNRKQIENDTKTILNLLKNNELF